MNTKDGKPLEADEALLVMIVEILVRKYGSCDTLVLEDFRRLLDGAPRRFRIAAGLAGDDLLIHIDAMDEETISIADLDEIEAGMGEEMIH